MVSTWLLRVVARVVSLLSWRSAGRVGSFLGLIWYHLLRIRRSVVFSNLRLALPDREEYHHEIARETYRNVGSNGMELLRMWSMAPDELRDLVVTHGKDRYREALVRGKGVIVVTAHQGNFDLLAMHQAVEGESLAIVSRELHGGGSNQFWMEARTRSGLKIFPEKTAVKQSLKWLRLGNVLGLVVDQRTGPDRGGVPAPFFGHEVWTSTLAARLAMRTGATLLPVRIERGDEGIHNMFVEPELEFSEITALSADESVLHITSKINSIVELWVRRCPAQWMWLHRRFRRTEN